MSFGPSYSFVFLDLLYGPLWSHGPAPLALSCFCVYLLFMVYATHPPLLQRHPKRLSSTQALNGVTESFLFAAVSPAQLVRYNYVLMVFSAAYIAACALLLRYGAVGLIAANALNMAMRIGYGASFAQAFFDPSPILVFSSLAPRPGVLLSLLASSAITQASLAYLVPPKSAASADRMPFLTALLAHLPHIGVGVGCLAGVGTVLVWTDKGFLRTLRETFTNKRKRE